MPGKKKRLEDAYRFPGFRPSRWVCGVFGDPQVRIMVLEREQKKPYLFTGLNLNKDGPWERAQRKSWTFSQMSCRMLVVSQEPESGATHPRTHGRVGAYPTGARSGPPTG